MSEHLSARQLIRTVLQNLRQRDQSLLLCKANLAHQHIPSSQYSYKKYVLDGELENQHESTLLRCIL